MNKLDNQKHQNDLVAESFKKDFGLSDKDLNEIPNFSNLNENQRALALKYITDGLVVDAHNTSLTRLQEETAKGKKWIGKDGKLKKIIFRPYYIRKYENETIQDKKSGKDKESSKKTLTKITEIVSKTFLNAEVDENGKIINYLSNIKGIDEKTINQFNKSAKSYSESPFEWDRKEDEKFTKESKIEKEYIQARHELINALSNSITDEQEVLDTIAQIDKAVWTDRFLISCPDAVQELKKIQSKWGAVKSMVGQKGFIAGIGFGLRAVLVGSLGMVAIPISGGLIGGYLRRKSAIESQKREIDLDRTKGGKGETLNFVGANDLKRKIKNIQIGIEEIDSKKSLKEILEGKNGKIIKDAISGYRRTNEKLEESSPEFKIALKKYLQKRLSDRLYYTQEKISSGTVNFSSAEDQTAEKFELAEAITGAEKFMLLEDLKKMGEKEVLIDLTKKRLAKLLGLRDDKIRSEKQNKIIKQTIQGAITSAGFAFAGALFRDFLATHGVDISLRGLNKKIGINLTPKNLIHKLGIDPNDLTLKNIGRKLGIFTEDAYADGLEITKTNQFTLSQTPTGNGFVVEVGKDGISLKDALDKITGKEIIIKDGLISKVRKINHNDREDLRLQSNREMLKSGEKIIVSKNEKGILELKIEEKQASSNVIEKGSNVWNTARKFVADGKITEKQFWDLWGKSTAKVNGQDIPLHKTGLVHDGDNVKIVLDESGNPERFELSADSGQKIGSDKDLYEVYKAKGKEAEAPNWLKESLGLETKTSDPLVEPINKKPLHHSDLVSAYKAIGWLKEEIETGKFGRNNSNLIENLEKTSKDLEVHHDVAYDTAIEGSLEQKTKKGGRLDEFDDSDTWEYIKNHEKLTSLEIKSNNEFTNQIGEEFTQLGEYFIKNNNISEAISCFRQAGDNYKFMIEKNNPQGKELLELKTNAISSYIKALDAIKKLPSQNKEKIALTSPINDSIKFINKK